MPVSFYTRRHFVAAFEGCISRGSCDPSSWCSCRASISSGEASPVDRQPCRRCLERGRTSSYIRPLTKLCSYCYMPPVASPPVTANPTAVGGSYRSQLDTLAPAPLSIRPPTADTLKLAPSETSSAVREPCQRCRDLGRYDSYILPITKVCSYCLSKPAATSDDRVQRPLDSSISMTISSAKPHFQSVPQRSPLTSPSSVAQATPAIRCPHCRAAGYTFGYLHPPSYKCDVCAGTVAATTVTQHASRDAEYSVDYRLSSPSRPTTAWQSEAWSAASSGVSTTNGSSGVSARQTSERSGTNRYDSDYYRGDGERGRGKERSSDTLAISDRDRVRTGSADVTDRRSSPSPRPSSSSVYNSDALSTPTIGWTGSRSSVGATAKVCPSCGVVALPYLSHYGIERCSSCMVNLSSPPPTRPVSAGYARRSVSPRRTVGLASTFAAPSSLYDDSYRREPSGSSAGISRDAGGIYYSPSTTQVQTKPDRQFSARYGGGGVSPSKPVAVPRDLYAGPSTPPQPSASSGSLKVSSPLLQSCRFCGWESFSLTAHERVCKRNPRKGASF